MSDAPLFDDAPEQSDAPPGFVSEKAKSRYGLTVAVVLGANVFLQMILPNLLMSIYLPGLSFGRVDLPISDVEHSAFWKGQLWYPETTFSNRLRGPGFTTALQRVDLGSGKFSDANITLTMQDPWLVPADDRLWLVTSEMVGSLQDGQVSTAIPILQPSEMSRPFLYEGTPAIVALVDDEYRLLSFQDTDWHEVAALQLPAGKPDGPIDRNARNLVPAGPPLPPGPPGFNRRGRNRDSEKVQAVSAGGTLFFFAEIGGTLYVHAGIPASPDDADENDGTDWKEVINVGEGQWQVFALDGEPVVVINSGETLIEHPKVPELRLTELRLTALKRQNGRWKPFFEWDGLVTSEWKAFSLNQPGKFAIVTQSIPGMIHLVEVDQGQVVTKTRFGRVYKYLESGALWQFMIAMNVLTLLPTAIAIVVIAWMMNSCRTPQYTVADRTVLLASLMRRSVARFIDTVIWTLPTLIPWLLLIDAGIDQIFEQCVRHPWEAVFTVIGWIAASLGWWLLVVILFSVSEGRWGLTPGKWLTGIRVVKTDLSYCGFWRALARNLVFIIDGFFVYMVGVGLIAFLNNWQRLGDKAANTIVIRLLPADILDEDRTPMAGSWAP